MQVTIRFDQTNAPSPEAAALATLQDMAGRSQLILEVDDGDQVHLIEAVAFRRITLWDREDPPSVSTIRPGTDSNEVGANAVETTDAADRFEELRRLVLRAKRAVWMDSNDSEIERLQDALDEACRLLHIDTQPLVEQAEKWAILKGLA